MKRAFNFHQKLLTDIFFAEKNVQTYELLRLCSLFKDFILKEKYQGKKKSWADNFTEQKLS